ncbi:MAG TPA: hypothetical protein VFH47_02860 [Candidatus Thermoplasmatota archaeon]|nr:hypothetical protein [Candidatus Thermoplasmatota archaeon]
MDDQAASPLTVILVAAAFTAILVGATVYLLTPKGGEEAWIVQPQAEPPAFVVAKAPAGATWEDVRVELRNAGGTDRTADYLQLPTGRVQEGQVLQLPDGLPAGYYVLRLLDGERELARAVLHT